jgi:hypothetical protein
MKNEYGTIKYSQEAAPVYRHLVQKTVQQVVTFSACDFDTIEI